MMSNMAHSFTKLLSFVDNFLDVEYKLYEDELLIWRDCIDVST